MSFRNLSLLVGLLFPLMWPTLGHTTNMPGYNCNRLGTSQLSDDRTMLIACLAVSPSANPDCSVAGACTWKPMTPLNMDTTGNAALGKTAPSAKLDVSGQILASRNQTGECCSSGNYTAAFAEATSTTGRLASLQFHNAGIHEGFLRLAGDQPRRFQMGDNQGAGMGLDLTGGLKLGWDGSACNSARAGVMRWTDSEVQYCNGSAWVGMGGVTGTPVNMYQCPYLGAGTLGGGAWGYYGCQGQITNVTTCSTIEFPRSRSDSCSYVGKMMLQP